MVTALRTKTTGLVLDGEARIGSVAPGNLRDRSRWANHGAFTNITPVQLPTGLWVMSFNGVSSLVNHGNNVSLNITRGLSFECWLNPIAIPAHAYIGGNGQSANYGYQIWLMSERRILFRTSQAVADQVSGTPVGGVSISSWSHIVVTRDGANAFVFINGVDATSVHGVHVDPTISPENTYLGAYRGVGSYINTYYAPPRIHNYALSAGDVWKRFQATRGWFGV